MHFLINGYRQTLDILAGQVRAGNKRGCRALLRLFGNRLSYCCGLLLWLSLWIGQPAYATGLAAVQDSVDTLAALFGTATEAILPPEQAFQVTAISTTGTELIVKWQVAPGTYLYQDKLLVTSLTDGVKLGVYTLPPASIKQDSVKPDGTLGDVAVYQDTVRLPIPLVRHNTAVTEFTVQVAYQGCAERGICYPPQTRDFVVNLPAIVPAAVSLDNTPPFSAEAQATQPQLGMAPNQWLQDLQVASLGWVLVLSLGLGLLVAFTACLYPMVPILSALLLGESAQATPGLTLRLSLAYTQGVALTFAVLGAVMAGLGQAFSIQANLQTPWVLWPSILLFVALALSMFGLYNIQIPAAWQTRLNAWSQRRTTGNMWSAGLMGVLSALIVGPCGGPILLAMLVFAAQSQDLVSGFILLWLFGTGMGLPLLLIGLGGGVLLPRAGQWMDQVKAVGGVILLALAISFLERLSPTYIDSAIILFAWGTLLVVVAVYLGALDIRTMQPKCRWAVLAQGLGLVLLIYGALFLYGAAAGGKDTWQPLRGLSGAESVATQAHLFQPVRNVVELEQALQAAKAANRPVMLDMYADWCTYCKTMEQQVFPALRTRLDHFVWLQADITRQNAEDRALAEYLQMIAPPAVYFWDAAGIAQPRYHLVGEVGVADILASAQRVAP